MHGRRSPNATTDFGYTFDRIATVVDHFTERLGLACYALFVQDYGGPVGFRLAVRWQQYLRTHQPPMLVVCGRYDSSFTVAGAHAYAEDIPAAEIHLLDAGHFALDQKADEIGELVDRFMTHKVPG